ncbi:glycoside hydrolase family 26 protein [Lacisediminihabitans changchengi]|uniref:Beta-mannanase n=1 Tax=Lacisediminihabitans changchengi TaxID=2787634 RepID=A0A934W487_9MICO|nr:glycosyl hydrolase [Lacisediminihabitans changchengi]MBK4347250.1 beta-mannanase [Lacisediminihabitans changchengi]
MRRSRPAVAAAMAIGLAAVVLLTACTGAGGSGAESQQHGPLKWGVYVPDDSEPSSDISVVTQMAGREPDYVLRFAALAEDAPIGRLEAIANSGAMPMLSLEPWVPGAGVDQPDYALATIAAGAHDADLKRWAQALAEWNKPVMLRFAHEMNGDWYPWAIGVNGNTAGDFVAAWRHVHEVFTSAGASKVTFVWAPNVSYPGHTTPFTSLYPGADSVDVLGLDGYNQQADGRTWTTPEGLFRSGLRELRSLPGGRPIIVTETATSEGSPLGTEKAEWINRLVSYLGDSARVDGFIWFQANKEQDWRFNSTAQAQAAMKHALARFGS